MASIIYSPKDIFEQEFKISMRGFDRTEVDEFLDNVINDYELFLAEIEALKAENERLKKELEDLSAGQTEAEEEDSQVTSDPLTVYGSPQPIQKPVPVAYGSETSTEADAFEPRLSAAATNFDILKRISRLEKEVFGKQIQE